MLETKVQLSLILNYELDMKMRLIVNAVETSYVIFD